MTAFLPPNLLALFAPRDPIPYLPPVDKLCHEKKKPTLVGVAQFLKEFEVKRLKYKRNKKAIQYTHADVTSVNTIHEIL